MTKRHLLSNVTRLAAAAVVAATSASCGGDLLRTGRAPAYLTIMGLQARPGGGTEVADNLLSDVAAANGSIFNDLGVATFRAELKDPGLFSETPPIGPTAVNSITINRYRINFRRADGRNTPGVDVPFGFDGAITATVPVGDERTVVFDIVRHANKAEPPLRSLVQLGGQLIISTVAEITFFGRDQYGNEVTVSGLMDVTFGDFPDDEE
jgi:hypothetical protein